MSDRRWGSAGSDPKVWDLSAAGYDDERQSDPVYASCVHQVTRAVPPGTGVALDAGCGTGLSTVALARRCALVVAVDYSLESLRRLGERGLPNVLLVQADLKALPFRDGAFGASVCANTLQHLDPRGGQPLAFAELRRVTAPRGTLSISVHHYSRGKRRAGWIREGKPGQAGIDYIYRFSRSELLAAMPQARIRGVGYYGLLRVPFLGSRLQDPVARVLGGLGGMLGYGHMLTAVGCNRARDTGQ